MAMSFPEQCSQRDIFLPDLSGGMVYITLKPRKVKSFLRGFLIKTQVRHSTQLSFPTSGFLRVLLGLPVSDIPCLIQVIQIPIQLLRRTGNHNDSDDNRYSGKNENHNHNHDKNPHLHLLFWGRESLWLSLLSVTFCFLRLKACHLIEAELLAVTDDENIVIPAACPFDISLNKNSC
jgi:hypothetical protein